MRGRTASSLGALGTWTVVVLALPGCHQEPIEEITRDRTEALTPAPTPAPKSPDKVETTEPSVPDPDPDQVESPVESHSGGKGKLWECSYSCTGGSVDLCGKDVVYRNFNADKCCQAFESMWEVAKSCSADARAKLKCGEKNPCAPHHINCTSGSTKCTRKC